LIELRLGDLVVVLGVDHLHLRVGDGGALLRQRDLGLRADLDEPAHLVEVLLLIGERVARHHHQRLVGARREVEGAHVERDGEARGALGRFDALGEGRVLPPARELPRGVPQGLLRGDRKVPAIDGVPRRRRRHRHARRARADRRQRARRRVVRQPRIGGAAEDLRQQRRPRLADARLGRVAVGVRLMHGRLILLRRLQRLGQRQHFGSREKYRQRQVHLIRTEGRRSDRAATPCKRDTARTQSPPVPRTRSPRPRRRAAPACSSRSSVRSAWPRARRAKAR
jgi:hypothetical protein